MRLLRHFGLFFQDKISQVQKRIKTSSGFLYQMLP